MSHEKRFISAQVPETVSIRLQEVARAEDRTVSAVIRRAIDAYLKAAEERTAA